MFVDILMLAEFSPKSFMKKVFWSCSVVCFDAPSLLGEHLKTCVFTFFEELFLNND